MNKEKTKKILKFSFKLAVSLLFAAWLVRSTNWSQVWTYARTLSFSAVFFYVTVLVLGMFISAWKWQLLLRHKNISLTLWQCFKFYLTGAFINNFMPSFIGGDTYRAYQAGKDGKRFAEAGMSVVFDRITGLFAAMLLTGVMAIFQWHEIAKYPQLKLAVVLTLLAMHAFIFFVLVSRFAFWKKIAAKLPKLVQDLGRELAHYREGGSYLIAVGISIFYSFVGLALVNWILFSGLGISIGIAQYLSVIFLISIVSALPVSINNIGIKEWAYVTFFGFFGVSASAVVAVALISRALQMIVSFTAWPMYLASKRK